MRRQACKFICVLLVLALSPLVAVAPSQARTQVGPLPTAQDFVNQQYADFLSRSPDSDGLAYWRELIETGSDPSSIVESLALSAEFQGTIAPVVRLYYAHLQRPPEYEGMTYWADVARRGWTMQQISEEFVLSQEFRRKYGTLTDRQYVHQVYRNVLGRKAESSGLNYWLRELNRGVTRGEVMVAFSDSAEYRNKIGSRVLATMLYVGMLRRAPEAEGLAYWARLISSGTPYRTIIAGFLGSPEYERRMGGIYATFSPLTGVAAKSPGNHPALAVKIDNVDPARPQTALERADIVYEEMVEGNLTRLIAVYHSDVPNVVGPVRSVRTSDIDVLAAMNRPLLAASGANSGVLREIANADVVNVNALVSGNAYYRSRSRRAPHNLYAKTFDLYRSASRRSADRPGGQPPSLFRYRTPGQQPASAQATGGVLIAFGNATIEFAWSPTHSGWVRTQNGRKHMTASGRRLAPENVVVLQTEYGRSVADSRSPEAHTVGSGKAFVFTAGKLVQGTWSRSKAQDRIVLKDQQGKEIKLTRGQTFVELAPPTSVYLK